MMTARALFDLIVTLLALGGIALVAGALISRLSRRAGRVL